MGRRPALAALLVAAALFWGAGGTRAADWIGGGPEIGWITTLMEASDGTLYAGTWGGGIFRSLDGGASWEDATTNARDAVVQDLLEGIDPARTLYAATSDKALLRKEQTSDFWAPLGRYPAVGLPVGTSLTLFPDRDTRIAFGTEDAVYISNTRGASWPDTLVFASGRTTNDLVVLPEIPNTIHALTTTEIVITTNSGMSEQFYSDGLPPGAWLLDLEPWSSGTDSMLVADFRGRVWSFVGRDHFVDVGPVEPAPLPPKYVCRVDSADGDRIVVGAANGLWISEDRLGSWTRVDGGMPSAGAEIWAIEGGRVSASDELRMGSFTLGFVRTAPGGAQPWTVSNAGLTAAWARTVEPRPWGTLCGTAHGRLYRTGDGNDWVDVTGSLRTVQISVVHDTGTAWIVSGSAGVLRSTDDGATWTPVTLPSGVTRLNHVVESGSNLLAATNFGLVASTDDGIGFDLVPGIPAGRASFALAVSDAGPIAVALERASGSEPPTIHVGEPVQGFVEIRPPAGFAGGPRGFAFDGNDLVVGTVGFGESPLYRIVDWASPGRAFVDLADGVDDGLFEVRDMDQRGNAVAMGTTGDGVFLSLDGARTWSEWGAGLPTRRIESVAFGDAPARSLWVSTLGRGAWVRELDAGVAVFVSGLRIEPVDHRVRIRLAVHLPVELRLWREQSGLRTILFDGLADRDLDLFDAPEHRGAASWGVDLWTGEEWFEVERLSRERDAIAVPVASRLLSAVPNPFNPSTRVRFELAEAGPVRLELFDARGRRVRTLVDLALGAGPHELTLDGRDQHGAELASGVYYLLLTAPDRQERSRVTLVR